MEMEATKGQWRRMPRLVADKGESEKVCGGRRDIAISDDI
jgi:hypothetical protein